VVYPLIHLGRGGFETRPYNYPEIIRYWVKVAYFKQLQFLQLQLFRLK